MGQLPLVVAALALAAIALAGCGLGAGRAPTGVQLLVSSNFGASVLHASSAPQVRGQETVMSLLRRNNAVSTRYSGGFVESIDGLAGGSEGGHPVDWFYYVNGVQAPQGAASTNVHPGDHIWWDRHDWSQTEQVPAVVGSFPEPFLNGVEGKRLPVRIECAQVQSAACRTVDDAAAQRGRAGGDRRSPAPRRGRRRCACSSGRGAPWRSTPPPRPSRAARARAASTRRSPRAVARSRCSTPTGARRKRWAPGPG